MIIKIKEFTRKVIAGANIATIMTMFAVGFSDYVNPADHPLLATVGLTFPIILVINVMFLFFWLIFCRRMVFIPLLGFVLCYVPVRKYIPMNIPHETPIGSIKVLSFNVHGYVYDEADNGNSFMRIIDYIKSSKADILCLQEDLGDWLHPKVHLDSLYAHSVRIKVGSDSANALGVYSRFPIERHQQIHYESLRNGSLACWLDINGRKVIVINNHFESNRLTADDKTRYKNIIKGDLERDTMKKETRYIVHKLSEAVRLRGPQADLVAEFIRSHKDTPIIVCGDFNDTPISYTHRKVAEELTDCYMETANGPGLSYNQKGFNVRIDNILCSRHFTPFNCKVDNKIHASDHYPIYCWLKFGYKP